MDKSSQQQSQTHPYRPDPVFRVGIVGHRPDRLQEADAETLHQLLREVFANLREAAITFFAKHPQWFSEDAPTMRLISPLAEGVDRMAAEAAAQLGYELTCPMPFIKEEYCRDFSPENSEYLDQTDSLAEFQQLLALETWPRPPVIFEIDGDRDAPRVYGRAGQVVMNQSEVLVAVWDGEYSGKPGGTEETIRLAVGHGIPVLWIDAHAPHAWQLIQSIGDLPAVSRKRRVEPSPTETCEHFQCLPDLVSRLLRPPEAPEKDSHNGKSSPPPLLETYLNETHRRGNPVFRIWKLFRNLVGHTSKARESTGDENVKVSSKAEESPKRDNRTLWAERALTPHYSWADRLAETYADAYRSGFLISFGLAALAVLFAVLPLVGGNNSHHGEHGEETHGISFAVACHITEAGLIIVILGLVWWAKRQRWHERWMDYRLIAELIRQRKILLPLGGGAPFPRMQPQHLQRGYGHPADTWMYWYVRALDRAISLPAETADRDYLLDVLRGLKKLVKGQKQFHKVTHERSETIEHRLQRTGLCLMVLTLVSALVHIFYHGTWFDANWLTITCAFFPAVGAAFLGIENQAEFGRIAKRSLAMVSRLDELEEQLDTMIDGKDERQEVDFESVVEIGTEITRLLIGEVSDWRVVFQDRPPVLPG